MTKEEFENYRFSIKTQVKVGGEWRKIESVLFDDGEVWYESNTGRAGFERIEDIREM